MNIINELDNQIFNCTIIDILNDKVYLYVGNQLLKEYNFIEYMDYMKTIISSNEIDKFFNLVSINRLETTIKETFLYKNLIDNKNYLNILKLVKKDGNNLIVVLTCEINYEEKNEIVKDNEELNTLYSSVGESLLKIYNIIGIQKNNITNEYIKNILDQLTRSHPELTKSIESDLIQQVNKTEDTILIVDDDIMTRNLLKKTFKEDYKIIEAQNGQVAIDLLSKYLNNSDSTEKRDNIVGIFLDIAMPVLDGFGVLEFLKNNNILNKIPVVVVSAAEDKNVRKKSYQYNIADMLEKPFNLDIIKHRTSNFINLYKTSNTLNELIVSSNQNLINTIEKLVKYNNPKVKSYIKIMLDELVYTGYINNSNMYVEIAMLAIEYDELLRKRINPIEEIIKQEGSKYNSITINIFKRVCNDFKNII